MREQLHPPEPQAMEKRARLRHLLRGCGSAVIGYSGGVDSVLLARVAVEVLGPERVLAVTGVSPSLARSSAEGARRVAREHGIPWREIATYEGDDPRYAANPHNRCYFCKSELWDRLGRLAADEGYQTVLDGSNADDLADHRPGARAAHERRVRAPLQEAGLTKDEIRAWSRELGLPTWDQPAAPCLASRLPYGLAVTPERLRQVERAEEALRALGLRSFRVRHHGEVARLELGEAERERVAELAPSVVAALRAAGFTRVLVDVQGYRRGALNEGLPLVVLGSAA
jgi:pyridinium-3,5-biscarboxylic acid mononucleotide sulfurtransferase